MTSRSAGVSGGRWPWVPGNQPELPGMGRAALPLLQQLSYPFHSRPAPEQRSVNLERNQISLERARAGVSLTPPVVVRRLVVAAARCFEDGVAVLGRDQIQEGTDSRMAVAHGSEPLRAVAFEGPRRETALSPLEMIRVHFGGLTS